MVRFAGNNLVVLVENSSSSEVAFTYVSSVDISGDGYDDVVFDGEVGRTSLAGQQVDTTVTVDYEYDDTASTGNHIVLGGILASTTPRFIRVRPIGSSGGSIQFSMDSVLLRHAVTGVTRDGKLMMQAVFKPHAEQSAVPVWGTI